MLLTTRRGWRRRHANQRSSPGVEQCSSPRDSPTPTRWKDSTAGPVQPRRPSSCPLRSTRLRYALRMRTAVCGDFLVPAIDGRSRTASKRRTLVYESRPDDLPALDRSAMSPKAQKDGLVRRLVTSDIYTQCPSDGTKWAVYCFRGRCQLPCGAQV
jgi:hypothetical protein